MEFDINSWTEERGEKLENPCVQKITEATTFFRWEGIKEMEQNWMQIYGKQGTNEKLETPL